MSFIGAMGVVAQQGNNAAVSAPTGVTVATSSSGNYDNSVGPVTDASGCSFSAMDISAQQWSNNALNYGVAAENFGQFDGCSAQSNNRVFAYMRVSSADATSYSWDLELDSQSLSNSCVASIGGLTVTTQDATGGLGIGEYITIAFGGGRGGQTYPTNGDSLVVTVKATATNAGGSTSSSVMTLTFSFISL